MGAPARCQAPQKHLGYLQGEKRAAAGVPRSREQHCVLDLKCYVPHSVCTGLGHPVRRAALQNLELRLMRTGPRFTRIQLALN